MPPDKYRYPRLKEQEQSSKWVHKYCYQVLSGEIVANKWIKLAAERHFNDLKRAKSKYFKYEFNAKRAQRAIDFYQLIKHTKGELAGTPMKLMPWQQFIVGSIFGWVTKQKDKVTKKQTRRFRTAEVFVARKNGKSTLASGIGLYAMLADGELGAEVYSAATTRDQARIVFDDAKHMLVNSDLKEVAKAYQAELYSQELNAKFRPLSSDANNLDGLNVHCALIDEIHAHKTREVYDVIETATGARTQPLIFVISTAGFILDVIDTTVAMFRGVDTVINSISSAFDSVTDFLNKLRDLPTFGGKHQLTSRAQTLLTDGQQSYIDNRGRSYNSARRYERLRDEEQAALDQMDNGRNLLGTITNREAARNYDSQKAHVQTYKSMLQQLAVKEGISGTLAYGDNISSAVLDKYNEAVDKANTIANELNDTASAAQSIQEFFLAQRDAIANNNNVTAVTKTPKQQAQEQRAENVRAARSRADNGFRTSTQNFGFKGLELGLDAYKAAQQRFIQIQQDSKTNEANIEQRAAKQRVLINAGADRDIAIERSRVYDANNNLLASATDQQVQAIQQSIARINAELETALAGIDVDTHSKRQAVLDKERIFQNQLLGIRRQFGLEISNEQGLENQAQLTQLTSYYDKRLANLETAYSKESELYRQLQREKVAALEELRTKQQEQQEAEQFAGNGFLDMFNRLTETKANAYTQQESMTKGYTNADITAAADSEGQKLDIMKASGNQLLAEGAKQNKKLFQLNKSMKIADALMSTYKGMAAAMEWGMPMGPVFAAIVGAQGFLQVNAIRQMQWSGQAHDGIDYVPNTGTWNLETGERVVDKRTNADLKRYLYDNNRNSLQHTASMTVDAGVTVNGNVTNESWFREQLALHREDLAYNLRQASASGYF
ncbi:terminase large subunit domain-containing protein [Vibrio harveyi]